MSPQIACMNPCWLHLICLHYVFSNVSSLWEYFDLQGPWQKVLTDLKKSLYTLQADPEKSRDFIIKNPGILINWKSRDPGIPGIPLGPGDKCIRVWEVRIQVCQLGAGWMGSMVSHTDYHSLMEKKHKRDCHPCRFLHLCSILASEPFCLGHSLRSYHNMSPPDLWKWKWSNGVGKSEMSIIWCISITNNVKSNKKFNETAQMANFTVFTMCPL